MLDRMITWLFIGVFGALWFFTRRCEVPRQHTIIILDKFGKQIKLDGLRTKFNTYAVAVSFAKHYRMIFPQYEFTPEFSALQVRRKFLISQK